MGRLHFEDGPEFPAAMDKKDPLRLFRQRFFLSKGTIYMCGNSLGLATKESEKAVLKVMKRWKEDAIKIWNVENNKYFLYSRQLSSMMAPLVGADSDEITIVSSTTINIHVALATFYQPTKERYKIVVDELNFPTDRYAVDSQVRLKGLNPEDAVKVIKSDDGKYISEEDIINAMTRDVALVFLPAVLYRSAQILDMKTITAAAKERGITIGWDLCHAIGAVEVDFKSINPDFAVWCTYKYLNGGPGSPGGLYINRRHFRKGPGMAGWFGNKPETQFLLRQEFEPAGDANAWQLGTPTLLSLAGLEGALKVINDAGISSMRTKSLHMTAYMMYLIDMNLSDYGCTIGNPVQDDKRGGHICLEHDEAYRVSLALKDMGVVPDFREPNVIRLTPAALYTSYSEVFTVVEILKNIFKTRKYEEFSLRKKLVV